MPLAGIGREYGAVTTTVTLNVVEICNLATFAEEHDKCSSGHPTRFTISATPTSIGSANIALCLECKGEMDITDYSCW